MAKSALTIANAFIRLSEPDRGDELTNLKLQKLLYYVQGFHLALYDSKLLEEGVYAWEHGPVVPEVYHAVKQYGSNTIEAPIALEHEEELEEEEMDLIGEVNEIYGQFSGWKLREMTHNESPWLETDKGEEITGDKLKSFFRNLVQD